MTQVTFLKSIGRYKANKTYEMKAAVADFFVKKAKIATPAEESFDDLLDLGTATSETGRSKVSTKKQKRFKAKNSYATREMKADD